MAEWGPLASVMGSAEAAPVHLGEAVAIFVLLLFVVALVSTLIRRTPVPFSVALVLMGILLGLLRQAPGLEGLQQFRLSPELILFLFLPTLLFSAAFHIDARRFLEVLPPVLVLAVPGVLLCALVVGAVMSVGAGLALPIALLFGAVVSATDPVAVLALFRELGVSKRLSMLMDGESLLNDGTALVLFQTLLAIVLAGQALTGPTILLAAWRFALVSVGGAITGAALAWLFAQLFQRVHDPMVEITLAVILAYGSFVLAEDQLHVSGVIATLCAGLVLGNHGRNKISPDALEAVESFWRYAGFAAEALLFLLVGLSVSPLDFLTHWPSVLWAVAAVLLSRAATIYLLVPVIDLPQREKIDRRFQTVMFWGGLRGAVAIAIALGLPDSFAEKELIITATLAVVLFTLFVNASTMRPLVVRLGLDRLTPDELLQRHAGLLVAQHRAAALAGRLASEGVLSQGIAAELRGHYEAIERRIRNERQALRAGTAPAEGEQEHRIAMQYCLTIERRSYERLFAQGDIEEATLTELAHLVEDRLDALRGISLAGWQRWMGSVARLAARSLARVPAVQPLLSVYGARRMSRTYEAARAQLLAFREIVPALAMLEETGALARDAIDRTRSAYAERRTALERRVAQVEDQFPEFARQVQALIGARFRLGAEGAAFRDLHQAGLVTEKVLAEVGEAIEAEAARLRSLRADRLLREPEALVRGVSFLADLPDDAVRAITAALIPRAHLDGDVIVSEGEVGDSLYFIGRGMVEVTASGASGERVHIATLRAGDVVGEMALLTARRRMATAVALTPCNLLQLRRADLQRVLARTPQLRNALTRAYKQRVGLAALSHLPLISALPLEEREHLAESLEAVDLPRGALLRTADGWMAVLCIVRSGELELTYAGGRRGSAKEEACFGGPPLFADRPETVRCTANSELLVLRELPPILAATLA